MSDTRAMSDTDSDTPKTSGAPGGGDGDARTRLVGLMRRTGAAKFSARKEFRLASGQMSDHYFDLRLLCGDPDGIGAVAEALYDIIERYDGPPRSVGGLESGSISIATAVSHLSGQMRGRESGSGGTQALSSFFVRKKRKEHGTQKMIEGVIESPVVVVDDVITSGGSALRAVDAVRDAGCECERLLCIIYRGSAEQKAEIERHVKLDYLFDAEDLLGRLRGGENSDTDT